jgi:hypothetical protein
MSILFHHYKELEECITEVELIEVSSRTIDSSTKKKEWLTIREEEEQETQEQKEENPAILNGYLLY